MVETPGRIIPENSNQEMLLAEAMKRYEAGLLSSGAAAQLANISRAEFLTKLADYGVNTFNLSEAELVSDLLKA